MRQKAVDCEGVLEAARLQANQNVGQGGDADLSEALERLRTRTHLVGDTTTFSVAPH